MDQVDVPQGRHGKHKEVVTAILKDLDTLKDGSAIKVPLADLAESKEKVRSALNRATRKAGRNVATASDDNFLYVWNVISD
jgi:DNA helicase TIP49 (TBP-interacting protein)